jgi:hypothetical protein
MTTLMRDIFLKPVDRPIDGVIKADDEASLRVELDEYVITTEIGTRLERFLDAYNNYQTANGVWISGFFGSGKSQFLRKNWSASQCLQADCAKRSRSHPNPSSSISTKRPT